MWKVTLKTFPENSG